MKEIKLTQGKVALVDDADFEMLSQYKWHVIKQPARGCYIASTYSKIKRSAVQMHRLIMKTPKGMDTDHINGDTLDNRRSNLRICTRSQNQMNKCRARNNTSGFKGVSRSGKKWMAYIKINRKLKHLGVFKDKLEAHQAYIAACKKYHGEYSFQNRTPLTSSK